MGYIRQKKVMIPLFTILCARAGSPGKVIAKEMALASAKGLLIECDQVLQNTTQKEKNIQTKHENTEGEKEQF